MSKQADNGDVTKDSVMVALSKVQEPELHRDLVSLNMIRDLEISGGDVTFTVMLTTPACPLKHVMERDCRAAVMQISGVQQVTVNWDADVRSDSRIAGRLNLAVRNTIAIASGKGGVGKTWFAVTLAETLARRGQRILLFDGDLGLANVDVQLGLNPGVDLLDFITGHSDLKAAITTYWRSPMDDGRLEILPGRSGSGILGMLTRTRLVSLKSSLLALAARYDHIILDLGAGASQDVLGFVDHGGTIFVVMNEDPSSLTDAYALIKLAIRQNPDLDIRIVVNQSDSKRSGEKTFRALERAAKDFLCVRLELAGIIRKDAKVVDSIRHQSSLLTRHPQAAAAKAVGDIARPFKRRARAIAV